MTVVDPIITLQTASGGGALSSDTNKDVGLAMQYHTGSAAKTAFLGFDDSAGKLTFVPDATISSEVVSGTIGTIVANLEGAVTGNADTATALATARAIAVSGDITGTGAGSYGAGGGGASTAALDDVSTGGCGSFVPTTFIGPVAPSYGEPGSSPPSEPRAAGQYFAGGGAGRPISHPSGGGVGGGGPAENNGSTNMGGGGGYGNTPASNVGAGGSGIVMIRYKFQ